jgi:hypothetical protein
MGGTTAMPEWLTRRDMANGPWSVEGGTIVRGDSWTEIPGRKMRAPIGAGEAHRVIRAREMMRARVSPSDHAIGRYLGASEGSLAAAEDFRVNTLTKALGFDTDALADGSERITGERLTEAGDHASLVHFMASTAGTKSGSAFLRGVRNIDESLAKSLREVEKALVKSFTKASRRAHGGAKGAAATWGDTSSVNFDGGLSAPRGYVQTTVEFAKMLDDAIHALSDPGMGEGEPEEDNEGDVEGKPELIRDLFAGRAGRFADLRFADLRLTKTVRGTLGRTRTATNTGRNPRRINRALTDPQRRVFDRTRRNAGGVVLIDQSGSMALDSEDVEAMMKASPGCTIIGYSHGRGRPNIWVMARGGRRCETVPDGNGGNGVDGPALRYAVEQARRGEPVVWVCDGLVTGHDDGVYDNLTMECARLVRRHNVHMARNVTEGIEALGNIAKGRRLKTRYVGNVWESAHSLGYVR